MSCFIVSDETMHRVVQAMDHLHPAPNDTARTVVGRMLYEMNNDAFKARYEGRYPEDLYNPLAYGYEPREATTGELYTAVQCFVYQCSEGNIPERKLYNLMVEVGHAFEVELTSDPVPSAERTDHAMGMVSHLPWDF